MANGNETIHQIEYHNRVLNMVYNHEENSMSFLQHEDYTKVIMLDTKNRDEKIKNACVFAEIMSDCDLTIMNYGEPLVELARLVEYGELRVAKGIIEQWSEDCDLFIKEAKRKIKEDMQ